MKPLRDAGVDLPGVCETMTRLLHFAFASTNLDFILRSRGIKTLAVAGFLTNCCVESTARTGYEKGFRIIALADCAATLSAEEQRFTFEKNLPMFARIISHTEFLADLVSE